MMRTSNKARLAGLLLAAFFAGCHDSSSGGGGGISAVVIDETEPNDTSAEANGLVVGETGRGAVADNTDTDFWQVDLAAGEFISIEAFAQRLDQAVWDAAGNAISITLFDTDGTTALIEHSDETFSWNSDQDTDITVFRAPAAGTYFLQVVVADPLATGGDYLVRIENTALAAPLQFEAELEGVSGMNDTDATAEAITPGTVYGFHVDDESDFYSFTVTNPSLVTFTTWGHRNGIWKGDTYYDPELNLYNSALTVLANNDDSFYLDSAIHRVLTTPGTYFIEVTECCASGDSAYFLEFTLDELTDLSPVAEIEPNDTELTAQPVQFGEFVQGNAGPLDEDYFSASCNAGDRMYVQVFDSGNHEGAVDSVTVSLEYALAVVVPLQSGGSLQFERTILTSSGTFFVHVTAANATDYAFRLTSEGAGFESEPNDLVADADTFDANDLAAGVIDVAAEVDLFSFTANAGELVVFHCLAENVGPNGFFELNGFASDLDPIVTVLDATSTVLASSDSSLDNAVGIKAGLSSTSLAFVAPTTGTFYVQVEDAGGNFGTDFYYVLEKR